MDFARPVLEIASLIISLALVGLVLSRATETSTVIESATGGFADLIAAATAGASQGVSSYRRR